MIFLDARLSEFLIFLGESLIGDIVHTDRFFSCNSFSNAMTWIWSRSVLLSEWTREQLYSAISTNCTLFYRGLEDFLAAERRLHGCTVWLRLTPQLQHKTEILHNTPRYWVQKINKKTYKTTVSELFRWLTTLNFSRIDRFCNFCAITFFAIKEPKSQNSEVTLCTGTTLF